MGKYCINCGKELHSGARFCAKCGASVVAAPTAQKQTSTAARPTRPAPQPQRPAPTPQPQSVNTVPTAETRQCPVKAIKKKKGANVLCIVLAVLLVVQTVVVALYGWPGLAVGSRIKPPAVLESSSFILREGQTTVVTDSGIVVDFGPYNAMDGEKVAIKEMSADTGSVEGGIRTAYEVTAGERTEFDGLLTITLPYNESETDAADEEGSVLAEYYNEQNGDWELVDYTVNTADNAVTITTDHLSRFCTVTVRDVGSPYALLSKFSGRALEDETALAILQEFEQSGQPGEVGDSLLRDFYTQFLPEEYVGNEEAELVNDVLGWLTDVSELAAAGSGYGKAAEVLQNSGYMLLGLAAVSLGGTMYNAYKGDESAETVAAQAYKLAYNAALAWVDFKQLTAGALQVSMLGVISIDYSLNKFMAAANQTYKDALFKTVIAYNEEVHPRTDAEWYAMILRLYQNHSDNPERFNQGLKGLLYNFSERYFRDNPEEQRVARNEAGIHAYTTDILPETEDAKQYCIEQYVARLGQKLQPVLEDVFKKVRYDAASSFRGTTNELRQALNAPLTIEILEEIPDGEKSKYAGAIVVISRPDGKINDNWTMVLDNEGRANIDATILGYIQSGVPTQLRLWSKGNDHYEDAPALTQEFAVTEQVTTIVLGNAGINAKWFEGSWRYGDHFSFSLEIIDNENCRHIGTADGEKIIHNSTYVFDPETSSITIAYSPGLVSLLETTYYGYVDEGVDYIKSGNNNTIYERVK